MTSDDPARTPVGALGIPPMVKAAAAGRKRRRIEKL
jgi:hypothetical protein